MNEVCVICFAMFVFWFVIGWPSSSRLNAEFIA